MDDKFNLINLKEMLDSLNMRRDTPATLKEFLAEHGYMDVNGDMKDESIIDTVIDMLGEEAYYKRDVDQWVQHLSRESNRSEIENALLTRVSDLIDGLR